MAGGDEEEDEEAILQRALQMSLKEAAQAQASGATVTVGQSD